MIKVLIKTRKKEIMGFTIEGHANFDSYGSDIVCAAVSMLSYTVINALDYYKKDLYFSDDDEKMSLLLSDNTKETSVILKTFEIGIKTLLENYSDYINLKYEEV